MRKRRKFLLHNREHRFTVSLFFCLFVLSSFFFRRWSGRRACRWGIGGRDRRAEATGAEVGGSWVVREHQGSSSEVRKAFVFLRAGRPDGSRQGLVHGVVEAAR